MRFFKDVSINIIGQLLFLVVVLGLNILIARTWGPEGKGAYSLLLNTSSVIMLVVNLGLSQAAIYYQGRNRYTGQMIAAHLLVAGLALSSLTIIVMYFLLPIITPQYFAELPGIFPSLLYYTVPSMIFRLYLTHLFVAYGRFALYALINVLDSILQLILFFLLSFIALSVDYMLVAYVVATASVTLLGWVYFIRREKIKLFPLPKLTMQLYRDFVWYGAKSYSASILTRFNLRFDQFLLLFFLDVATVGIYSVSVALAELTSRIGDAITMVLFSRTSSQGSEVNHVLTSQSLRFSISISALMAIGLILLGPVSIRILFGAEFVGGTLALLILLPGTILANAERVLRGYYFGIGTPEYSMYANLITLIIMIGCNIFLIPRLGINGAAISSTVAYSASAWFLLDSYARRSHESCRNLFLLNRDDIAVVQSILSKLNQPMRRHRNDF